MTELEELLRMRSLSKRNCNEEAKERLMLEAADEIAKLKEALRKYGGHLELCERMAGGLCTCGLSTVL